MDDDDCAIFGTVGYQAPEIARTGPDRRQRRVHRRADSRRSRDGCAAAERPLRRANPRPRNTPVLAKHESLYRAIIRATDPDPGRRFASMDELADQLTGVLHEIVTSDGTAVPQRMSSALQPAARASMEPAETRHSDPAEVIAALSVPVVDLTDPGSAVLATTSGTPPAELEAGACAGPGRGASQARVSPSRSRCDWFAQHWRSARRRRPGSGSRSWNRC